MNKDKFLSHCYGQGIHLLESPYLSGILARLGEPDTLQPELNRLLKILYLRLIETACENEFEVQEFCYPTRMSATHPGTMAQGIELNRESKAICVNLARAGTYPSHLCFEFLHTFLKPSNIRQDHVFAFRKCNSTEEVIGTDFGGHKIGGNANNSYVIVPDPMGATGSTIEALVNHYKTMPGKAKAFIALHLIVTPEYLQRIKEVHPDVKIYALRLDRGLSDKKILETPLGTYWKQERGLNEKGYIVPGAGGLGEILNNSFV